MDVTAPRGRRLTLVCCAGLGAFTGDKPLEDAKGGLRRQRNEADHAVKHRTIRFEGQVIPEPSRPCVPEIRRCLGTTRGPRERSARLRSFCWTVRKTTDGTTRLAVFAGGTPLCGEEKLYMWGWHWWFRWLGDREQTNVRCQQYQNSPPCPVPRGWDRARYKRVLIPFKV